MFVFCWGVNIVVSLSRLKFCTYTHRVSQDYNFFWSYKMYFKDSHYKGWKFYKRQGLHNYYLAYENRTSPARNFYLTPKISFWEGQLILDRLHIENRYRSCLSSWHKRNNLSFENLTECTWWKIENRAPTEVVDFFKVELERILECPCSLGRHSFLHFCSPAHLLNVDRKYNLVVE